MAAPPRPWPPAGEVVPSRGIIVAGLLGLAGASGLPARRVAAWSVLGAGLWAGVSILVGYVFASSLDSHLDAIGNVLVAAAGGLLLAWALRPRHARPLTDVRSP